MPLKQITVEMPYGLGINLYLMNNGEAVLSPQPTFVTVTEDVPDGVSSFIDIDGLILWEKGSAQYEYNFNYAYFVNAEPLLRGWLRQQKLSLPE
jgi:hypothetical protein